MNKVFKLLSAAFSFIFLGASALNAQGNFDLNGLSAAGISARGTDKGIFGFVKPGKPEPRVAKEWTVMVFMNAKNNLSDSILFGLSGKWAEKDIDEMKKVGTTERVNVVVEHGIKGKGSRRLLIKKKDGFFSSGEQVYGEYPGADMGDYKRVIEFVKWSKTAFPAKHYILVLWNHGLGWIDPNIRKFRAGIGTSSKGILFDDETENYVRTSQLGEILRQTGYVDVFAMNACLMQMAEVAYEVKDNAGLIVASEEIMLSWGFDYEKLLNFMNANTGATNEQISDFFINWERDFFASGAHLIGSIDIPLSSIPGTISTVRPQALNDLPAYLDAFAGAVIRNNETDAVKEAIETAVRFSSLDPKNDKKKLLAPSVDLYDLALITGQKSKALETRQAAENLTAFIKSNLVLGSLGLNSDTENGYDYSRVGGIAINMTMKTKTIPPQLEAVFETGYGDLALSKASQWDEFVTWADGVWRK